MIRERIAKLIDLRSFVTAGMTVAMILLLFLPVEPNKEILVLFCTSYGAVMAYYFNKDKKDNKGDQ